jgi:hypothetical protein
MGIIGDDLSPAVTDVDSAAAAEAQVVSEGAVSDRVLNPNSAVGEVDTNGSAAFGVKPMPKRDALYDRNSVREPQGSAVPLTVDDGSASPLCLYR